MTSREDALVAFHFAFEVEGLSTGYFLDLNGTGDEHHVIDHNVVTPSGVDVVYKLPGRSTGGATLTMKQGITSSTSYWSWRAQVEQGDIMGARRNGSLVMYNQEREAVARWDFVNAWPSKIDGPMFSSDANTYGIEEMTIVTESFGRTF